MDGEQVTGDKAYLSRPTLRRIEEAQSGSVGYEGVTAVWPVRLANGEIAYWVGDEPPTQEQIDERWPQNAGGGE